MFNQSLAKVLTDRPFEWTTEPVFDGMTLVTPGVKNTPSGVFLLLSDELIEAAKDMLTTAEKAELSGWLYKVSTEEPLPAGFKSAGHWHVTMWAGSTRAVLLRVPAATWNDPTGAPPAKVKSYLAHLWREAEAPLERPRATRKRK